MNLVRNNVAQSRFELDLDGGNMAVADYRLRDGVMAFVHTEVPWQGRGQGVGSRLMEGALALARAQQVKVLPRCSFVADYLQRHPEYSDLLA